MKMYVAYECDAWHTTASKEIKGIFSSKEKAIDAILNNHEIHLDEIFDLEDINNTPRAELIKDAKTVLRRELFQNNQTQDYEINYGIDVLDVNKWD